MIRTIVVLLTVLSMLTASGAVASTPEDLPAGGGCERTALQPFGTAECPGVRPGGAVSAGSACTLNFLFRGSDGARYIGTAGHCVLEAAGEIVWRKGAGPEASGSSGERIGEFAYAIDEGPRDFALIRLDHGVDTDPQMCFFGGPTGVLRGRRADPFVVHHFGHGSGIGSVPGSGTPVLPARSALARDSLGRWQVFIHGVATPGDSGSPVITEDGRAVGVLIGIGVGDLYVSRLTSHVRRAARQLNVSLHLMRGDI